MSDWKLSSIGILTGNKYVHQMDKDQYFNKNCRRKMCYNTRNYLDSVRYRKQSIAYFQKIWYNYFGIFSGGSYGTDNCNAVNHKITFRPQ